jgi:hypothetical protein
MTNASLITSLIVAAAIAGIIGWLLARWKQTDSSAATLASGLAALTALPILLHFKDAWTRSASPKEALEWIPWGLTALSVITLLHSRDAKRAKLWISLGWVCCFLLAVRMMWGSVYLKVGSIQWPHVALLLVWVTAMAWCWSVRLDRRDKPNRLDASLQVILLFVIAVNLGLSGSLTYFAAGLLFLVISAASWLGVRRPSATMSVMALALLGLGPTFAETSWWSGLLLLLAILGTAAASLCPPGRARAITVGLVSIAALTGSVITFNAFQESISNKNESSSGYEAYR